jgi:CDP-6-deoxy-D-xylo-4-hexulose-3-dehydrase
LSYPPILFARSIRARTQIWYAPHKFEAYGDEEIEAVTECLRAGWLAPGPRTAQFEEEVAAFFGKKLGVFVNSGSSANMLALLVAGVSEGVEVVTPALTFSTVIAPLLQLRAKIVFCDAMPTTYVASVDQVMAVVTENTKVIFLPNLIGSKPDWAALRKRIDDAVRPAHSRGLVAPLYAAQLPPPALRVGGIRTHAPSVSAVVI